MPLNPNDPILAGRVPLVDQRGNITKAGYYFLLGLRSLGSEIDADSAFAALQFANSFRGEGAEREETLALLGAFPRPSQSPVVSGQAIIPFASMLSEDSVTIAGQPVLSTSAIVAQVYADNDDVYAQDWQEPVIRNIVPGAGFDIVLRPMRGQFAGPVKMNWQVAA